LEIIYTLLPISLLLGALGCLAYFWCIKTGQYDDLDTPPQKMLTDDLEDDLK
jgi:cbb3-type cytochrome oxidase maturation protein